MLPLITLLSEWLVCFSSDNCSKLFLSKMDNRNICVDAYLEINSFLSANQYLYGVSCSCEATLSEAR